jgi:predicted amidophosphoribosyltransferase
MLRETLNEGWLAAATLVPVPSSKTRDDPEHDDQLPRILRAISPERELDIRELVVMTKNVFQSHLAEDRVSIEELIESMGVDEAAAIPLPRTIGIFDDVLTTGKTFSCGEGSS